MTTVDRRTGPVDHAPPMQQRCSDSAGGDGVDVVVTWTGRQAVALQRAMRLTNEAFAEHLGVAVRTVASWHNRAELVPRAEMQQVLDTALDRASRDVRDRFSRLTGSPAVGTQALQAAIAVVVRPGEVLLVCRRDSEAITWQFPAGVVKPGAQPATVAVRETLAETGVHCAVRASLGQRVHPVTGVLCHYLLCDYLAGEAANLDEVENVCAMWVARSGVTRFIPAARIFPPVLQALEAT